MDSKLLSGMRPIAYITIELAKFDKSASEVKTDLEKLAYTMKTLHTTEQYPAFWNEEWLLKPKL